MKVLSANEKKEKILSLVEDKIFSVKFIKKSTGELRQFNARLGVSKGVKGVLSEEVKQKRKESSNICCYVMKDHHGSITTDDAKQEFRTFDADSVVEVVCSGTRISFE